MGRIFTTGGELGGIPARSEDPNQLLLAGAAPTLETTIVRSGVYSLKCPSAQAGLSYSVAQPDQTWWYARVWFYLDGLPTGTANVTLLRFFSGIGNGTEFRVDNAGTLAVLRGAAVIPGWSTTMLLNQWVCLEIGRRNTLSTKRMQNIFRVNGAVVYSEDFTSSTDTDIASVRVGNVATGGTGTPPNVYIDDIAINDESGSYQNSFPGTTGKIVFLRAASDNAVGADWKRGAGGAISANAYDSVNNLPPVGVSNSAPTDGAQIRDSVSNVSAPASDIDINLETYVSRIPSGQKVTVLHPTAVLGDSSNTLTVDAEYGSLSNPTSTRPTYTTQGGNAATWPSSWTTMKGTLHEPTVTQSAAPVVRLGKRTAATTALMCCLMGAYVEYEPSGQRYMAVC